MQRGIIIGVAEGCKAELRNALAEAGHEIIVMPSSALSADIDSVMKEQLDRLDRLYIIENTIKEQKEHGWYRKFEKKRF